MARSKLGNVFEIDTKKGGALLQYIHFSEDIGEMTRVFFYTKPQNSNDLSNLSSLKEDFFLFFPLSAAFRKGIVRKVGHAPVPASGKPKYMRTKHAVRGEFLGWHIVDVDTWKRRLVKDLSDEEKQLSPWGIWNDTLLIERLEAGWTLDNWV